MKLAVGHLHQLLSRQKAAHLYLAVAGADNLDFLLGLRNGGRGGDGGHNRRGLDRRRREGHLRLLRGERVAPRGQNLRPDDLAVLGNEEFLESTKIVGDRIKEVLDNGILGDDIYFWVEKPS